MSISVFCQMNDDIIVTMLDNTPMLEAIDLLVDVGGYILDHVMEHSYVGGD